MRHISFLLPAAALGLVLGGTAQAADVPGFNEMDKNNDGQLTRSEAQGNPKLADQFNQVDGDNDGHLSRTEYLAIMGRQDLYTLRENLAEFLKPEGQPPLAAGGQQAGAGATAAGQDAQGEQSLSPPVGEQFVRNVQDKLRAKGIDAGPVDGIWGPRTHAGLREFQQKQGLDATGQLNAPTLEALGIPGEAQAATGSSSAADRKQDVQGVGTPQSKKQPFAKLDTDNDGFLGHAEAAADRDAGSRFHELDTNNDQKVSRAEYDAWDAAGSKRAATGATGKPKK